jgi:Xaa-Pro aminopeptidase
VIPFGNADLVPVGFERAPVAVTTYGDFVIPTTELALADLAPEEKQLFDLARDRAGRSGGTPVESLVTTLQELVGGQASIAIETEGLLDGDREAIREFLPGCKIAPASPILRQTRAVKTRAEVERLRRAARLSVEGFERAVAATGPGDTELDLERRLLGEFVADSGLPFLTSVTSGRRTALPNGQATDRALRAGDLVRFDGGCRYRHYASDIARIATVTAPTDKQRRYYDAVVTGIHAAESASRPGATGGEVFDAAMAATRRAGIPHYERAHCGHGIGIENYDLPRIAPGSEDILEPGMVVCLETPYYEIGWGGVQAEDTYEVTADGLDPFTRMPDEMQRVGANDPKDAGGGG